MPCIKIIGSIKLYVYLRDHNPPHFHAMYAEYEELIEIESLETFSGKIPIKQRRKVIQWATQNREFLMKKWIQFNPKKK
ncbi:MAG: DUF4160 domain-containing protein [Bacteroidota bacterium]